MTYYCKINGNEKLRVLVIYRQEFRQEMPLQKYHNYGHLVILGQARKLPSHSHYHGKNFYIRIWLISSMFESKLSWYYRILENSRSNKSLEISDNYRHEAIVHVFESLLCKLLLSFDNSKLTDSALVFLGSCKVGPERHPLFCHLARRRLITRYFCLLFSNKSAHF